MKADRPRLTLIGYGNRARGDDAAGPLLLDKVQQISPDTVFELQLIEALQLNPENAYDLIDTDAVIFIDADSQCRDISFRQLQADSQYQFSSHSQSPESVLALFEQLEQRSPPPCYLLGIGGHHFELGEAISQACLDNLKLAEQQLGRLLQEKDHLQWSTLMCERPCHA